MYLAVIIFLLLLIINTMKFWNYFSEKLFDILKPPFSFREHVMLHILLIFGTFIILNLHLKLKLDLLFKPLSLYSIQLA